MIPFLVDFIQDLINPLLSYMRVFLKRSLSTYFIKEGILFLPGFKSGFLRVEEVFKPVKKNG